MLEKCEVMIALIRNEINYIALPSNELIGFLSKKEEFKELKFIFSCLILVSEGEEFPQAWKKSLNEKINTRFMKKKDVEIMEAFGESFGITDAQGQISNCELCLERLRINHFEAKRDFEQYSKLASGLGFLLGLGILIIFL